MPVASVPFLSGATFHNCFETPPSEQSDSSGWLELTLFMDGSAVSTINDISASVQIIVGFFLLSNKLNMIKNAKIHFFLCPIFIVTVVTDWTK